MRPGKSARNITYAALLGAVSILLLYGSAIVPTGSIGVVALAGIPCAGVVIAGGVSSGLLCWGAVSVLGFFLVPDKACVLMYAAMFGLYPVVKSLVEGMRRKPLEIMLKLVFFNVSFSLILAIAKAAILEGLPIQNWALTLIYLVGNIVFMLYDYGFSGLIAAYLSRVGKMKS